jgi:hypothetical protein
VHKESRSFLYIFVLIAIFWMLLLYDFTVSMLTLNAQQVPGTGMRYDLDYIVNILYRHQFHIKLFLIGNSLLLGHLVLEQLLKRLPCRFENSALSIHRIQSPDGGLRYISNLIIVLWTLTGLFVIMNLAIYKATADSSVYGFPVHKSYDYSCFILFLIPVLIIVCLEIMLTLNRQVRSILVQYGNWVPRESIILRRMLMVLWLITIVILIRRPIAWFQEIYMNYFAPSMQYFAKNQDWSATFLRWSYDFVDSGHDALYTIAGMIGLELVLITIRSIRGLRRAVAASRTAQTS